MQYNRERALELLRIGSGKPNAQFYKGQEDAIKYIFEGNGRLLNVQATGWGKSFVYFIACKLLREADKGPALLISPLLALMRNQIDAAVRMGVRAVTINSNNFDEWMLVEHAMLNNEVDIALISPERLANERFINDVLDKIASKISLLVIDEAHCISDWGHDFRPHYRLIERKINLMPRNMRILATTATANNRVLDDLKEILGDSLKVDRGDLNRPSLCLQTIKFNSEPERMAWLAEQVPQIQGSGIIYTLTIRDAMQVADWLKHRGMNVEAYTGQTDPLFREDLEKKLLRNQVKALVATSALGMGFDKPDIGFVIHYQAPGSVVSYYQQVGRAGRAIKSAYGVLLTCEADWDIVNFFINSAFPTRDEVDQVIEALAVASDGLAFFELLGKVNIKQGRLEKVLDLLALEKEQPLVKQDSKWYLTPIKLTEEFWDRVNRLTSIRKDELK